MGNLDLARKGAHVMDTLAQYDHLPALGNVMLCQRRTGFAVTAAFYGLDAHRAVALWAHAFSAPVFLLRSKAGGRVKARMLLGGEWVLEFNEPAHDHELVAYASRLGLVAVMEKRLTVAAFLLQGAVEAEMAVAS
jgi:hypothetical protein